MTGFKTLMLAALLSTASVTSVLAQEPAAFQSMFPNRDVLNGGALTPAGRSGLELDYGAAGGRAANNPYAGSGSAGPSLRGPRYQSSAAASNTLLENHRRRSR